MFNKSTRNDMSLIKYYLVQLKQLFNEKRTVNIRIYLINTKERF